MNPMLPIYAIYGLCGAAVLQGLALAVLLIRRPARESARVEARLAHLAEALTMLTDTTQAGFASLAGELARREPPRAAVATGPAAVPTGRAATSKRIVSAVRKGRSIQDVAANEGVSESEVRLHLGLAEDAPAARPAARRPTRTTVVHDAPARVAPARRRSAAQAAEV